MGSCGGDLLFESNQRQQDMERGAFGEFSFHFELPGVFLDDSVHNRQAQARPVIFRGEKWIEDVRDVFIANALAIVAHGDAQNLVRLRDGDGTSKRLNSS